MNSKAFFQLSVDFSLNASSYTSVKRVLLLFQYCGTNQLLVVVGIRHVPLLKFESKIEMWWTTLMPLTTTQRQWLTTKSKTWIEFSDYSCHYWNLMTHEINSKLDLCCFIGFIIVQKQLYF